MPTLTAIDSAHAGKIMSAADRYVLVNSAGLYWTKHYTRSEGNWTSDGARATSWESKDGALVNLCVRRSYFEMAGRNQEAASLTIQTMGKIATVLGSSGHMPVASVQPDDSGNNWSAA